MIVLRNVWKWYDDDTVALRGVTLTVPRDDFVFLVGRMAPARRPCSVS